MVYEDLPELVDINDDSSDEDVPSTGEMEQGITEQAVVSLKADIELVLAHYMNHFVITNSRNDDDDLPNVGGISLNADNDDLPEIVDSVEWFE